MLVEFVVPNTARAPADRGKGSGDGAVSKKSSPARVDGEGRHPVTAKDTLNGTISTEAENGCAAVTPGKEGAGDLQHISAAGLQRPLAVCP